MDENWRTVENCGKYQVSDRGNVRNIKTGKTLKKAVDAFGYEHVVLTTDDGDRKIKFVHRLVAEAFLDNKGKKRTIDHIDGDKRNNDLSNLRWATYSENSLYYVEKNPVTQKRHEILQYSLDGNFMAKFANSREAERATGIKSFSIFRCCKGNLKSAGGFQWVFMDDEIQDNIAAYEDKRKKYGKTHSLKCVEKDGTEHEFGSMKEAVKFVTDNTDFQRYSVIQNIAACLKGRTKTAYGYVWIKEEIKEELKN